MQITFWYKDKAGYNQVMISLETGDLKKILRIVNQRGNANDRKLMQNIDTKKVWITLKVVD